ncbi:hypothetical protein LOTGIDRAFT_223285 [Lottia gigantea]|uniref:Beta-hexosaminidase n=1 Tax=Lottia gigantea TaxID=225164 RepID=V3ZNG0_LOTGI|nr:hypothetical protein LOTGIDRAFT_223285 [Lottia gigantea]ESO82376.1 hypothetical protein LOTGIDRAFT_223285 [Lottia gigantea]
MEPFKCHSCLVPIFLVIVGCHGYINYLAIRLPLQGERPPPGSPWPQPKQWQQSPDLLTIDPIKFQFTSDTDCDIITKAFERYHSLIFGYKGLWVAEDKPTLPGLEVVISSKTCGKYPSLSMDESYSLVINNTATLTATEVWGFLRGLETFSQLVYDNQGELLINKTSITDVPRFPYRGSHLDTARHYIPIPVLKQNLDAMSYNKLNVFHWHIVDDQSFPFVSKTFPKLSEKGAYSKLHLYTPEAVADIIEYARLRGIRVIPEFDTPGHTASWGIAYQELLTTCWANGKPGVAIYNKHAEHEILDPTKNFTYEFLGQFFKEVSEVFPDEYLHMGMDEGYYYCWFSNPNITEFMTEQGFGKDYFKLEQYYSERVLGMISDLDKKYIIWQDPVENGAQVRNDSIVTIWKGGYSDWRRYMESVSSKGYYTILSSCWYLNYLTYPPAWRQFYSCDPLDFTGSQAAKDRVLGGQTCLWAEFVDGTNLLTRMWPSASAAAERLWSPAEVRDNDTAYFRLDQQRCRMLRRGIPTEPLLGGYCGDYEWGFEKDEPQLESTERPTTCINTSTCLLSISHYQLLCVVLVLSYLLNSCK